jgi:hypothetical protein
MESMATKLNDNAKRKTIQSSESTKSEGESPADKKKKSDFNEEETKTKSFKLYKWQRKSART